MGSRLCAEIPEGPVTVVGVLTGCLVFLADLIRRMPRPLRLGLVQASSYRGAATSPGELRLDLDGLPDLTDQTVLLLDDIFDTGKTLTALREELLRRGARRVVTVVLLWKAARRQVPWTPDHFGFEIPDEFVVGYGLDHQGDHRHLPHIAVLEPEDLAGSDA
jgi:hypoxanthine phosphoribosyltransferase